MIESLNELKAGDIFLWKDYPLFNNKQKDRWFIFLGRNFLEALIYQVTSTTQKQHYEKDGKRIKNNFFEIPAGIGGFTSDSIIDITTYFENIYESFIIKYKTDIDKKGVLPKEYVNILLKCIDADKNIPKIVKKDIARYFENTR